MEGAWGRIPIDVGRAGRVFQEQTGREGLVSCMSQKGRPPGDPSRAGHGAEHWWCIVRSGFCHQAKEGCGFRAETAACFDPQDDQAAPSRLGKLRIGAFFLLHGGFLRGQPRHSFLDAGVVVRLP